MGSQAVQGKDLSCYATMLGPILVCFNENLLRKLLSHWFHWKNQVPAAPSVIQLPVDARKIAGKMANALVLVTHIRDPDVIPTSWLQPWSCYRCWSQLGGEIVDWWFCSLSCSLLLFFSFQCNKQLIKDSGYNVYIRSKCRLKPNNWKHGWQYRLWVTKLKQLIYVL